MIMIDLIAKCDECPAEERETTEYQINNIPAMPRFLRSLRDKGWKLARDESYKLAITLCPDCAKDR